MTTRFLEILIQRPEPESLTSSTNLQQLDWISLEFNLQNSDASSHDSDPAENVGTLSFLYDIQCDFSTRCCINAPLLLYSDVRLLGLLLSVSFLAGGELSAWHVQYSV